MTEQFLAPALQAQDDEIERSLRPRRLEDFVGQERVKEQLRVGLDAAISRGEALDHVLLVGPPGLGKTSLAFIIHEELGVGIRTIAVPSSDGVPADALVARDALVELGYSVVEAERALAEVDPDLPAEERVREALKAS